MHQIRVFSYEVWIGPYNFGVRVLGLAKYG